MKEQVQTTGTRKWYGDDWTTLQNEINLALSSLLSEYGNCILSGANVTDNGNGTFTVADGFAFLLDSSGLNGKICRVYQATYNTAQYPVYLVQGVKTRTDVASYGRVYGDGQTKDIINEYYAKFETVQPGHSQYITINSNNANKRWRDAIQSASFRFVTDTEKSTWNGKADKGSMNSSYIGSSAGIRSHITAKNGTALPSDYVEGLTSFEFSSSQTGWPFTDGLILTEKNGTTKVEQRAFNMAAPYTVLFRRKTSGSDTWTTWKRPGDLDTSQLSNPSSITPDLNIYNSYDVTALAQTLTINAPTGAITNKQKLLFEILDNGTTRTLSFNTGTGGFAAGGFALPTATTAGKMMSVLFIYDSTANKWKCRSVITEA